MNISVILPAAGLGSRFTAGDSSAGSKVEYELRGKAVFLRAADLFLGRADVTQVILAVDPARIDDFRFRWADKLSFMGVTLVPGGVLDRWETVQRAVEHVSPDATHIAVHDAARPLASPKMIDRVLAAAQQYDAVVPGLGVSDTLKRVAPATGEQLGKDLLDAIFGEPDAPLPSPAFEVVETVSRDQLYRVQTPQVFRADLFRVDGIGEEYSDLLEASGVDTVVELSKRDPEHLHAKLLDVNGRRRLVRRPPALKMVEDWIAQAKKLPRAVEY